MQAYVSHSQEFCFSHDTLLRINKSPFYTVLNILKKTTRFFTFALATSIVLLSACGQKGPLYLPVKPAQVSLAEIQSPATVEKTKATK
ncbi:MAG: lipoprotein [Pseudomonadota bacterium]